MKSLEQGEEVMLVGPLMHSAAHADGFNPCYGLVVKDHGWNVTGDDQDDWKVTVLWEDGRERTFDRALLRPWSEINKEIGKS